MIDAYKILIGTKDGNSFVARAASREVSFEMDTNIEEIAATSVAFRHFAPSEIGWKASASCLLVTHPESLNRGQMVHCAIKLGDEVYYGEGEVTSNSWSGGVQGVGELQVTIEGNGLLTSDTILYNDWILVSGYWDDNGFWRDLEFWHDAPLDTES